MGETASLVRRFGDYEYRDFYAATDFKVGEAIRFFCDLGHKVRFGYRKSDHRAVEEKRIIRELIVAGFRLLNSLPGYAYETADREDERDIVKRFCEMLLRQELASWVGCAEVERGSQANGRTDGARLPRPDRLAASDRVDSLHLSTDPVFSKE